MVILPTHVFAGPMKIGAESKDYSALWHCRNRNLTAESPQISTRRLQTPDKAEWTQEVLKSIVGVLYWLFYLSLFVGKLEGSQTCLPIDGDSL